MGRADAFRTERGGAIAIANASDAKGEAKKSIMALPEKCAAVEIDKSIDPKENLILVELFDSITHSQLSILKGANT